MAGVRSQRPRREDRDAGAREAGEGNRDRPPQRQEPDDGRAAASASWIRHIETDRSPTTIREYRRLIEKRISRPWDRRRPDPSPPSSSTSSTAA